MMRTIMYLHETGYMSGAENSLLGLVSGIDKARFRAVAVCPAEGGLTEAMVSAGARTYSVYYPPVRWLKGVWPVLRRLRSIILEERVALVHSNSIRTHLYAVLAARDGRLPVVWHERNLLDRSKDIMDLDRVFSFLPDAIIVNSRAVAERFKSGGKIMDKVRIIHNGVDMARFTPAVSGDAVRQKFGIGRDEIVIGIASRFNKIKGHEVLFSAVADLLGRMSGERGRIRVFVAGSPVFNEDVFREEYLKEFVRKLKIDDRVIFAGQADDMPGAYAAMDIFVLTSLIEACGRVVIEAMAAGKPAVGTRAGGTPEIIVDGVTGVLVPPGDVVALSGALEALIIAPERRLAMGGAARKRAEESFGIERNTGKTEALYDMLLKGR